MTAEKEELKKEALSDTQLDSVSGGQSGEKYVKIAGLWYVEKVVPVKDKERNQAIRDGICPDCKVRLIDVWFRNEKFDGRCIKCDTHWIANRR